MEARIQDTGEDRRQDRYGWVLGQDTNSQDTGEDRRQDRYGWVLGQDTNRTSWDEDVTHTCEDAQVRFQLRS